MNVYLDTSALAKWYLNEAFSEEVEEYLREATPAYISALTKVEMKSLLARHRRDGSLDPLIEARVFSVFETDIAAGHLILLPLRVEHYLLAESLLGSLPNARLRALDALHLGALKGEGLKQLATADRVLADAAEALGVACRTFF
ncbi:MAG TPA: type II toxin-antitoxin system VapC family toxin [Thermoleophilia bacterium]|nr:type II toxin-antitoxin system VapC family toxin [Thermoleophilia bacterium]